MGTKQLDTMVFGHDGKDGDRKGGGVKHSRTQRSLLEE